jgi:hypothetical protein
MSGFSLPEKLPEGLLRAAHITLIHQETCEMRA